ncbi:magnesium transporter [soil metagenome]
MVFTSKDERVVAMQNLLFKGQREELLALLKDRPVVEVAEFHEKQTDDDIIELLGLFSPENQGYIFSDFNRKLQLRIFFKMETRDFAELFSRMPSDDRVDFYQYLKKEEQEELLPFLEKKTKQDVLNLSGYRPDTAGGIMNTDFATVLHTMTMEEALARIRKASPSKKMIYYLYVVDEQMKLLGFITIKNLLMAELEEPILHFVNTNFVSAHVEEDQESVAEKIGRYDLVALPVVNEKGQLVGIVRHDDALDIVRREATADFERFMGIMSEGDTSIRYLDTTAWSHFRKRVVWIVGLAAVGILSGVIIHSYEEALDTLRILALYMPMMADTGGNVGSQAATVVVRALALGEITARSWFKVIFKEAKVALLIALCLGVFAYGKV